MVGHLALIPAKNCRELEKQFGIRSLDKRNIKVDSPIRSVGLIDVRKIQDITGVINLH